MARYLYGCTVVDVQDGYTTSRFWDRTEVCARHDAQLGQEDTASRIGMTVCEMNEGHDRMHAALADMLGLRYSPTLHDLAHGDPPTWLHALEEDAVLACQKFQKAAAAYRR